MITLLRQLIVEPVRTVTAGQSLEQATNTWHYGLLLASLLVIGVLHKLVTSSEKKGFDQDVATSSSALSDKKKQNLS